MRQDDVGEMLSQGCHLHLDRGHHAETRRQRHNLDLFEDPTR